MKKSVLALAAVAAMFVATSCSNGEEKSDTVIIEKETTSQPAPTEEKKDNVSIDAEVDKDGNVSGGISVDDDL
jgi:hypothetical protein